MREFELLARAVCDGIALVVFEDVGVVAACFFCHTHIFGALFLVASVTEVSAIFLHGVHGHFANEVISSLAPVDCASGEGCEFVILLLSDVLERVVVALGAADLGAEEDLGGVADVV